MMPRTSAASFFRLSLVACGVTALALAGAGCDEHASAAALAHAPSPPKVRVNEACRIRARATYQSSCRPCHGELGAGDGPGAASLNPKPRNFRDLAWQRSVKDEHIEKVILKGGASVGKSSAMPGSTFLEPTPGVVAALREHVRGFVWALDDRK